MDEPGIQELWKDAQKLGDPELFCFANSSGQFENVLCIHILILLLVNRLCKFLYGFKNPQCMFI